jgi:hypothetical protein
MSPRFWRLGSPAGFGLVMSVFLNACLLGGTGTGTGNGLEDNAAETPEMGLRIRYTDSLQQPVPGLTLQVWPADYSPLEAAPTGFLKSVSADSFRSQGQFAAVPGRHRLHFTAPGTYVVTAIQGGAVVSMDTVRIASGQPFDSLAFQVDAVKRWAGRITLESKMRIDSGWLVVYGTQRMAKVDSSGAYDLGHMPVHMRERVRLSLEAYRNHPLSVVQATRSQKTNTTPINPSDTSKPITDTARGADSPFPNGAVAPDTIQVLASEQTSVMQTPKSIPVKCITDSLGQALCVESEGIPYIPVPLTDAAKNPEPNATETIDPAKPTYTEAGKILPSCSVSTGEKSSDDLVAAGSGSDFILLDVSATPTCAP